MPYRTETYVDIGGYSPYISGPQSPSLRVLRGRNYRWRQGEVVSGWGGSRSSLPVDSDPSTPNSFAMFQVQEQSCMFTPTGVYLWTGTVWETLLVSTPDLTIPCEYHTWPWSRAFVGDSHYFSHPLVGIIRYCVPSGAWLRVSMESSVSIPADSSHAYSPSINTSDVISGPILGITQAECRLIILASDTVSWSAIDAGFDINNNYLSSGFMSLSVGEYGYPLAVHPFKNDSFVIFSTGGITVGRAIDSIAAFNLKLYTRTKTSINPHAISQGEDGTVFFLDKKGLFILTSSNGNIGMKTEAFEIGMSKWIMENLIHREHYLTSLSSVKLHYSPETEELFLSFPPPSGKYTKPNLSARALVFNFAVGKWASLDQPHFCLGPVNHWRNRGLSVSLGILTAELSTIWFDWSNSIDTYPLNSFVALGPLSLEDTEGENDESTITKVGVYASNYTYREFGQLTSPLGQDEDNWEDPIQRSSSYILSLLPTQDLSRVDPHDIKQLNPDLALREDSFFKIHHCNSSARWHIVKIKAGECGEFYAVSTLSVAYSVKNKNRR